VIVVFVSCCQSRGVRLLHDKAPVHTAAVAKAGVKECGFEEIEHPPYSPDLAPSGYHLFSKLKKDLRGKKFYDGEDGQNCCEGTFCR